MLIDAKLAYFKIFTSFVLLIPLQNIAKDHTSSERFGRTEEKQWGIEVE